MLADDLQRGKLDRRVHAARKQKPDLDYKLVAKEPLVASCRAIIGLPRVEAIDPHDLAGETFIGISNVPRVLRGLLSPTI